MGGDWHLNLPVCAGLMGWGSTQLCSAPQGCTPSLMQPPALGCMMGPFAAQIGMSWSRGKTSLAATAATGLVWAEHRELLSPP